MTKVFHEPAKVAEFISREVDRLLKTQDSVVLGLPGGRSVTKLFPALKEVGMQWRKVHVFMVDERLVPIDDSESNFFLVDEQLTKELMEAGKLPPQNIHPFIFDDEMEDHGAKEYEATLNMVNDHFDIVVLGVGEDGHVAGLFPNYTIKNDSDYFFSFHDSPKPPKDRMTSSRKLLQRAKLAVLLFVGGSKKEAYERYKDESISIDECPAKLADECRQTIILTDVME